MAIKSPLETCPHCPGGIGLDYILYEDDFFYIVCDAHPLVEGHILIITKEHISCIGAMDSTRIKQFERLYNLTKQFLKTKYGSCIVFEHGIVGQTVFHAHVHFLPCNNKMNDIYGGENKKRLTKLKSLDELKLIFDNNKKYLFLDINDGLWLVEPSLGYPRYFRDIFGKLMDVEERVDWKKTRDNHELMHIFKQECTKLTKTWKIFFKNSKL